ncbi:TPA: hypothetical protein ACLEB8_005182 [Pseudomonas aeruginosa]
MSQSNAILTLMTRNLEKLGYPTDDIRFSLGYCQGDGSSFSGPIDLKVHGPRLLPDVSKEIWATIDCELKIDRDTGCRYVHERSVDLNVDCKCVELTDATEYGGVAQKLALHKLVVALEADIISASEKNNEAGYKLIESYVSEEELVWSFRTHSLAVELYKVPDQDHDPFSHLGVTDDLDASIEEVLSGSMSIFGSKVVISLLDEDGEPAIMLAENCTWGHGYTTGDATLRGLRRELVSEAVQQARETYKMLLRPTLKAA